MTKNSLPILLSLFFSIPFFFVDCMDNCQPQDLDWAILERSAKYEFEGIKTIIDAITLTKTQNIEITYWYDHDDPLRRTLLTECNRRYQESKECKNISYFTYLDVKIEVDRKKYNIAISIKATFNYSHQMQLRKILKNVKKGKYYFADKLAV